MISCDFPIDMVISGYPFVDTISGISMVHGAHQTAPARSARSKDLTMAQAVLETCKEPRPVVMSTQNTDTKMHTYLYI